MIVPTGVPAASPPASARRFKSWYCSMLVVSELPMMELIYYSNELRISLVPRISSTCACAVRSCSCRMSICRSSNSHPPLSRLLVAKCGRTDASIPPIRLPCAGIVSASQIGIPTLASRASGSTAPLASDEPPFPLACIKSDPGRGQLTNCSQVGCLDSSLDLSLRVADKEEAR